MKTRPIYPWALGLVALIVSLITTGCSSQTPGEQPKPVATVTRPAATSPTLVAPVPVSPTPASAAPRTPTVSSTAPGKAPGGDLSRTGSAGSVTVVVTPLNLERPDKTINFQVVMDTHSVELTYDLTKIAVLRDDRGREYTVVSWGGGKGGHHLSGELAFPATNVSGQPVLSADVKAVELVMKGIGGEPSLVFRWEL